MAGSAQEATKPERFGRYVLLDRIGMGGMAEVFRAVMPGAEGFRRTFVVKRILGQLSQSDNFIEMFAREARICGLLNHPSIVQVYDFGNVDGSYFLAMEYVRGRDLQAVLRRARQTQRPIPVAVAVSIAREVAECLGYAHALAGENGKPLNIIHRDVSPSNIMCALAGGVKLLDFGIAKTLGDEPADRTERGAFKGKLSYMAPERIKREPIDGRSDLFSLGVVLWEMLAGRRLFRSAVDLETLKNVLEAAVPLPSSLRPDVPPELDAVVMRALERDPEARYPTGHAMAEDLEDVLHAAKHHSKMLPKLLQELFGSGLQSTQIPLSPELFDFTADSSAGRSGSSPPDVSGPTPVAEAPVLALAEPLAPEAREVTGSILELTGTRWTFRRFSVTAFAVSATATLGVLLFGRGGGGQSHATMLERPPAVASVAPSLEARVPAAAIEAPAPSVGTELKERSATPSPVVVAKDPDEADETPPPSSTTPSKRTSHSRSRADRDRIARGLSIDPFAEASRRGSR